MIEREAIDEKRARMMNPVVLAFVGDAVYTLYVRTKEALSGDEKANALNKKSAKTVSAVSQAKAADALISLFTEEEAAVFRRARNAKKSTRAKNASVAEYHKSTGLEAVIGYLYLTGQEQRLLTLLSVGEGEQANASGAADTATTCVEE